MPGWIVAVGLLAAGLLAFVIGIARAKAVSAAKKERLHSRTGYYGSYLLVLVTIVPLVFVALWSAIAPQVISHNVENSLPANYQSITGAERGLIMNQVRSIAAGLHRLTASDWQAVQRARYGFASMSSAQEVLMSRGIVLGGAPNAAIISAAYDMAEQGKTSNWIMTGVASGVALLGFIYGFFRISPKLRARNTVEGVIKIALGSASTLAVLTTFGIVMSVLFETLHFFQFVNPFEFFFGTVWDPRFAAAGAQASASGGQFGLIPLLWGTLFISAVALSVAVPIGLLSAIYMSEYANKHFRDAAKPMLEVLAGIPTIVYGFFALTTVGPMLRDFGAMVGLNISASSVLTAGLVMGIMIIPYVSSLSDDIINAVPQSLRDGAYALGSTKSETIRRVVMPAALPGIVGAILLAASRAIGETMIVVLAAGIAAKLTLNPFEAVTTMTVKIVSQLTGDLEFSSPQTLVAFALGLTLFGITLCLNVYALYVVRKYREQYE